MDLASVVAALASVGVRVSGSTPNNNIQGDSSRACPTGLAGPEPSGTHNDPGQHFHQSTPDVQAVHHISVAATQTPQEAFVSYIGVNRARFSMKVPVEKMEHVLVDTGAEINLIRSGLLPSSKLFETPHHKINLMVANKQSMKGGEQACSVDLQFYREYINRKSHHNSTHTTIPIYTYEGDIQYDLFRGNPWLFDSHVGPFAHRGCLFMGDPDEHEESASWLYPQFKTIPEQWDKHVKEYFPPCVQEVARNKNINSSNMLTHHGDLEPFDLQSNDPSTSYKTFLKLIQRKKAMLPPKA